MAFMASRLSLRSVYNIKLSVYSVYRWEEEINYEATEHQAREMIILGRSTKSVKQAK